MTSQPTSDPNKGDGASGNNPANSANSAQSQPKLELKEGKYFLDGKAVVYEHDLIAAKKNLETQLTTEQQAHSDAIDKVKLETSNALKQVAVANEALKEAQQASKSGAVSAEEVAKLKQDLADAKTTLGTTTTKLKDYRVKILAAQYGMPVDKLSAMSDKELDAVETAASILGTNRNNPGSYALPGTGAGGASQLTAEERVRKVLDATPVRGDVNKTPVR